MRLVDSDECALFLKIVNRPYGKSYINTRMLARLPFLPASRVFLWCGMILPSTIMDTSHIMYIWQILPTVGPLMPHVMSLSSIYLIVSKDYCRYECIRFEILKCYNGVSTTS